MQKTLLFFTLLFSMFGFSCNSITEKLLRTGTWRATLKTETGLEIPFVMDVEKEGTGNTYIIIRNGEERITVDEVTLKDDSVWLKMPLFDSEIRAGFDRQTLKGRWIKHLADKDVCMDFVAVPDVGYRFFKNPKKAKANISGRWETLFIGIDGDSTLAIGEFTQKGEALTGTFLTTTGDYRFLEGNVVENKLYLSCFDGSHAFLFTADIVNDSTLSNGRFYSGLKGQENWTARKNEKAELPDAYQLTYLKPGHEGVSFSFPDLDGKKVSLSDSAFKNKVIILQLMGSWCPNCADEMAYLSDFYGRYEQKGVEIIGLAYERSADFEKAKTAVNRMRQRFYATYPILIAGTNAKGKAQESLPMLNQVLGFPTTIIIDKHGKVSKIHTGFTGPSTGEHYTKFVTEFEALINQLIAEK